MRQLMRVLLAVWLVGCGGTTAESEPEVLGPSEATIQWSQWDDPAMLYRPWVRWWWPGNDVTDSELKREIELLASNGFGGAEIQAFNAALNPEASTDELQRRLSVDSGEYWTHIEFALDAAGEAGLAVDLTLGSGWPTGGPHVTPGDSMKTLVWGEKELVGGEQVTLPIPPPEMPAFYQVADMAAAFGEPMARYLVEDAELVALVAARVTGGDRASNPLVLDDVLELEEETLTDLTDAVAGGEVTFSPAAGKWNLIAVYQMADGQFPSLPATESPGFVMDYLDAAVVSENLNHWLPGRLGKVGGMALRGFFTDSFELKTERWTTDNFFHEFEQRRGYDLVPYLPAVMLPGADNHIFDGAGLKRLSPFSIGGLNDRLQHDYARTLSDLFLERFVEPANQFALGNQQLISRAQGYGLNVDPIAVAAATELPEAEQLYAGGTDLFIRLVTSGAHLGKRNTVSAESLVWSELAHLTTPAKIRVAADKLFAAGVNHLVYHGFPYSKQEGYGEAGWHAFCSPFSGLGTFASNISESNPFWPALAQVNRYVARLQYLLRTGAPARSVLIYYPFIGVSASLQRMDNHQELFFNGDYPGEAGGSVGNPLFALVDSLFGDKAPPPGAVWLEEAYPMLRALDQAGYVWDFVNDAELAGLTVDNEGLIVLGSSLVYEAVVLANAPALPPDLAESLATAAERGAQIVIAGSAPTRQPGFFDYEAGDARVAAAMTRIKERVTAPLGLAKILGVFEHPPFRLGAQLGELRFQVRVADPGAPMGRQAWFAHLHNPGTESHTIDAKSWAECDHAWWLDGWRNVWWRFDETTAEVTIPPLSSLLFFCNYAEPSGEAAPTLDLPAQVVSSAVLPGWTLTVTGDDVEGGEYHGEFTSPLPDWRDLEELRYSSSLGTYSTLFELPATSGRHILKVEQVRGSATVRVNGETAGELLVSPFEIEITDLLTEGTNAVELAFTPPLRNRLVGHANANDPAYPQFKTDPEQLAPTGIVGEIVLVERL